MREVSSSVRGRVVLGLMLVLATVRAGAAPVGTAFTYQGSLRDGTGPAEGSFDLEFTLFDAASGGSPIQPALVVEDVAVEDGLFTVSAGLRGRRVPGRRALAGDRRPAGSEHGSLRGAVGTAGAEADPERAGRALERRPRQAGGFRGRRGRRRAGRARLRGEPDPEAERVHVDLRGRRRRDGRPRVRDRAGREAQRNQLDLRSRRRWARGPRLRERADPEAQRVGVDLRRGRGQRRRRHRRDRRDRPDRRRHERRA